MSNFGIIRMMFDIEKEHWKDDTLCIGIDEVGRGAFAGPMAVGAVVLPQNFEEIYSRKPKNIVIRDSKKMTELQRERSYEWIITQALGHIVEYIEPSVIDAQGLGYATQRGFTAVAEYLYKAHKATIALIDGFEIKKNQLFPSSNQHVLTKGEDKSISIAAASIVAKVTRDKLMIELSEKHPEYLWHKNKGYGTQQHRQAIHTHGLSQFHRRSFIH